MQAYINLIWAALIFIIGFIAGVAATKFEYEQCKELFDFDEDDNNQGAADTSEAGNEEHALDGSGVRRV